MEFLQSIQKDIGKALAQFHQAALLQVLRDRAATVTFDELRQLLASPIGKSLGSVPIGQLFANAAPPAPSPANTTASASAAKPRQAKQKKAAKKKQSKRRRASTAAASTRPRKRPAGVSPEKAREVSQRVASVFEAVKRAARWLGTAEVQAQVGGTSHQVRYALEKLEASGQVKRQGVNHNTEWRASAA